MKTKIYSTILVFFIFSFSLYAQNDYWLEIAFKNGAQNISIKALDKKNYRVFQLNIENFKQALKGAPHQRQLNGRSTTLVKFPDVNGKFKDYRIVETSIFSDPNYAAIQHPNIKTYLGFSADGSGERVRFSVTPLGLTSMISIPGDDTIFIQPITKVSNGQYLIYNRHARTNSGEKFKYLIDNLIQERQAKEAHKIVYRDANDQLLRTFRIAISTTKEYTAFWDDGDVTNGDAKSDALAAAAASLNRINEIFEVDMAITFVLVDTADDPALDLVYSDTDPYSGLEEDELSASLQTNLTNTVGLDDFDLGHLFHKDRAVVVGYPGCTGCVCDDIGKGAAYTVATFEDDDLGPYLMDSFERLLAGVIGTQMGANYTQSFQSDGTGANVEPASGTTIMSFAGYQGPQDVQAQKDPYFHYYSINEILNNIENKCATTTPITNAPPVANAGADYNIPPGTAFILKGQATDDNVDDVLTYTWEQIDDGEVTKDIFGPTNTQGASWRSKPPSTSPNRYMPIFSRVLNGTLTETNPTGYDSAWETVSTVARELNFALTVRDRSETDGVGQMPQSSFDTMKVTVEGGDPFTVLTPEVLSPGAPNEIFWTVGETDNATINCQTVTIKLSTDGGLTFPMVLASNVPNDGSEMVDIPSLETETARLLVEASDNIFYAVSNEFSISTVPTFSLFNIISDKIATCDIDEVTYDFSFQTANGFSETVTFSATGSPQGSTVVFSPATMNSSGTFTMTVSSLELVDEGVFSLEVLGTSASITKTVSGIQLTVIGGDCEASGSTEFATGTTGVLFNTISNLDNGKPGAYSDYTAISTEVEPGDSYDLTTNVNTDGDYEVLTQVWIDWNQNCVFEDSEQYNLGGATNVENGPTSNSPLSIIVPSDAIVGETTMRINTSFEVASTSCQTDFDGEVEDYTVEVIESLSTDDFSLDSQLSVYPNPNKGLFNVKLNGGATGENISLSVYDVRGRLVYEQRHENSSNFNEVVNLKAVQSGLYLLRVSDGKRSASKKILINSFRY